MEKSREKMIRVSNVAYILTKVIKVIGWVAIGCMVVAATWLLLAPELNGVLFQIGSTKVYSPVDMSGDSRQPVEVACEMISGIVAIFLANLLLYKIRIVLADMKEGLSPFTDKSVDSIKKVSLIMLLMWFVPSVVQSILSTISKVEIDSNFSFDGAIFALIVYCIALAFDYGTQLQKNADETL